MYIILIVIAVIVFATLIFILYEKYEQNTIKVTSYEVGTKFKNSKDLKIVQISDLHSKCFGENNIDLINKINEIKPNIIILTGDIIDRDSLNYDVERELLKKLAKKYDVYYVLGNHEITLKYINLKEYLVELKTLGVKILLNDKVEINKNVDLYGINYYPKDRENMKILKINNLLKNVDEEKINIVLIHDPNDIQILKKYKVDFAFAGHVHGGVIRLFKKGLLSPDAKFFPKYFSGKYKVENTDLYVSSGLSGKGLSNIRIHNKPEIIVFYLRKNVVRRIIEKKN